MRRNPAFALTAILTLAIGVAGSTTMFTVIHSVLLNPLAYPDPDRLVRLSGGSTIVQYQEFKPSARSYTDMGAFLSVTGQVTLYGKDGPEVLKPVRVSANFLQIVGIQPVLGRYSAVVFRLRTKRPAVSR